MKNNTEQDLINNMNALLEKADSILGSAAQADQSKTRKTSSSWDKLGNSLVKMGFEELKKGIRFMGELDEALTAISYTSGMTKSQLKELGSNAVDMAGELNTSARQVLDVVKIYSAANSSAEEIMRKTRPAVMLSNISGMSGAESAEAIHSALNQFGLKDTEENLMDIADTLTYISSQLHYDFSDGMKEITEGIATSGSAAKAAGLNMQEYAAMVGLAVETAGQSGSSIGSAYQTMFSRITNASFTEGTSEEDISAAENSLRSIGVEVRNADHTFRDLSDTLADVGTVWDSLSSAEKSNVGFQIAGTRDLDVLNGLFGMQQSYEAVMSRIGDRSGMALQTQEEYAASLKGRLGELEATGQSIWNNIIDSEALKSGIDLVNTLAKGIEALTGSVGSIPFLSTIGAGIAGAKGLGLA